MILRIKETMKGIRRTHNLSYVLYLFPTILSQ